MKKLPPILADLAQVIRALERSAGRPRARKNARRKASSRLRALRDEINQRYPAYDADGKELHPPARRSPRCAICGRVFFGWKDVAIHMRTQHGFGGNHGGRYTCVCGAVFESLKGVGIHLAKQVDPKAHATIGRLAQNGATK